jgi:5-formyltetrahydrofolate cyclo-ligase
LTLSAGRAFHIRVKESLRKSIRRKLAAMDPAVAHAKSMAACKRLQGLPEFQAASVMMIYLPMPGEVDVTPLALRGWQQQKTIAAPKLSWDLRHMLPIQIRSLQAGLVKTRGNLREPADGDPVALEMLDLVICPALAFDRKGNRLGRGAGFYDRFLAAPEFRGVAAGIGFREQLVDELPAHRNDIPVDILVTDEEVLRFPRRGQAGKDAAAKR